MWSLAAPRPPCFNKFSQTFRGVADLPTVGMTRRQLTCHSNEDASTYADTAPCYCGSVEEGSLTFSFVAYCVTRTPHALSEPSVHTCTTAEQTFSDNLGLACTRHAACLNIQRNMRPVPKVRREGYMCGTRLCQDNHAAVSRGYEAAP